MINYGNHKQDSTADSNLKLSHHSKNKHDKSYKQGELSILNEDLSGMLQNTHYDHQNNSSVMNLSDLIMHNNPALQNLL